MSAAQTPTQAAVWPVRLALDPTTADLTPIE